MHLRICSATVRWFLFSLALLFAGSELIGAPGEAVPDRGFYLPADPKYSLVDSAQDSVRFTLTKTLQRDSRGHLVSLSSFVDPEGQVMGWHDFGNLEGPGWAANAVGGAWEIYTLGGFLHKPDWQSNALCILDHVLEGGFLDERTGFIRSYRETTSGRFCLNYKHNSDWFCPGSMAKVAFQLLLFADELGADPRAQRMRTAAVRTADWLKQNLEPVPNGWFTRRANPEGKIYRLSPEGGQDKFWQTSADGLFIVQLQAALTQRGLADYRQLLRDKFAVFQGAGGIFGSINHDTYDPQENVAYSVACRTWLLASRVLRDPALRTYALEHCLRPLDQFKMREDRNGVATRGLLYMEKTWDTAYLWENAEAALAYFEAAVEVRETDPVRSREHEMDGLVILRACAKHHHGAYGFLTEGVDWNDHVGQKHHIEQAKYGAIRYTEPFLNNQHIAEPTLFYLKHFARKQPAGTATEWLDLEGNCLLRRASAQSLSTPTEAGAKPAAETTVPSPPVKPASELSPQQRRRSRGGSVPGVYKAQVTPHWFQDNTRFWYRNDLRDGTKEFIEVEVEGGTRRPAFDHTKLAGALSKACGQEFKAERLPFAEIEFIEDGKAIRVEAGGKNWRYDLTTCECSPSANGNTEGAPPADEGKTVPVQEPGGSQSGGQPAEAEQGTRSPDGKWSAFVRGQNVFARQLAEGAEFQLSQDGCEGNGYGRLEWAPDSSGLVAWRIEPGDIKDVYLVQSSPPGGGRAVLHKRPYALPGDKFARYELSVFDVAARKQTKPQVDLFAHEWEAPRLHWARDKRHFAYVKVDRGHQRFRVIEIDARTGESRNLVDERTDTFIWTAHTENLRLEYVNWLEKTDEMVYVSERDGWRHLYLVDTREGKIKTQITPGEYVVRGIEKIDEEQRQIWFSASGRNPNQDPYLLHFYRVNFDGTGLTALTEGNGNHSLQYSPDRKYVIDTYSRVDMAPVHELRRVADGGLVCKFEEADITELKAGGWQPPEVFVAKGRDGKTDIWGIICRPRNLDAAKKYPVIEDIYAGPQDSFVPKSFGLQDRFFSLANLGFIVVQIDGMGTANRSKAFHDVCWKNLKDAGLPDRILWHQAVAAKYPYYDISRVGIFGTSAGAQSAAGALLFHPEFYKVAVANSGCHDNRMDKASWNEQWMGYPVGPQYAECSNIENAGKLQGHLMLVVGEMDDNVPPESTYRLVDALIKASKDFDLLVVPNGRHGAGGEYGQRRLRDFFLRHLAGVEPPNRNAEAASGR